VKLSKAVVSMLDSWKGGTPLEKSIRVWTTNPTEKTRHDVCVEMAQAKLLVAEVAPAEMLTGDGPHGRVLLAFTTSAELRRRSPTAKPVPVSATGVHTLLCDRGFNGVVINPSGRWVFLSRDDVGAQLETS
jgi:hypothetical protein